MKLMKNILSAIAGILFCVLFIGAKDIGNYPDKIWLHRCNSIEKLWEKHRQYPNIEADVIFLNNRTFDVTHDESESIGLNLSTYFAYMREHSGKIWLDIKNLTSENKESMLSSLQRLARHYHISKERLIIESPDWESLDIFTKNGFYTSFYVTYEPSCKLNEEEKHKYIKELQRIADSKTVCALSFPGFWYRTVKERLGRSIDLLTWEHRKTQLQLLLSPQGRKMLSDPQLKVILVKDKGAYHR